MPLRRSLAILAAVAALAGCGGDDDPGWVARADAICADTQERVAGLEQPQTLAQLRDHAEATAAAARRAVGRLRALGDPPQEIRAPARAYVEVQERQVGLLDQLRTAAAGRDVEAIRRLAADGRALEAQARANARRAGLQRCGRAPQAPGA